MKTCYIFSAAEGFPKDFKKAEDDLVIAADAGYGKALRLNITPDLCLGDFDSLGFIPENIEIIKHAVRKDDTDTMLAVKTGLARGFKRFIIYGCTGGRLDHTLANIQTLNYIAERGGRGYICADDFCITALKNGKLKFKKGAKGNISLFSAKTRATGVTLKGLSYKLDNAEVGFDFPIGVSNEFTGKPAEVSVKTGVLTVIWQGTVEDVTEDEK